MHPSPSGIAQHAVGEGPGMRECSLNKIDNSNKNNQKHRSLEVFLQILSGSSQGLTVYFELNKH